ncbi:MAG: PhoH family protein, partial [Nitrosomonadaceae bacterium]
MRPKPVEISFPPADNQRLANLCGVLDENLVQIESALDVSIIRRGEHFSIRGKVSQTRLAAWVIQNFYSQAKHNLSIEQVQLGLIEVMNPHHSAKQTVFVEQGVSIPALITRRSDLHGRTPRQVRYLKQIQEHDITFSIGPAGTGKTYLAVASAVDALERDAVERIVLV